MNISLSRRQSLPETYVPGRIYFTEDGTYVAISDTEVQQSASVKPLRTFTDTSIQLVPNTYYRKTNQSSSLTITLAAESNTNIINEYFIEFTTAATGTTIALPSSIKWANGEIPVFESDTTYQISIINDLGICVKFK